MAPFPDECPFSSQGEVPEYGLVSGGTMLNRIVYPPKPPTMTLTAEWQITFEDMDVTDPEEQGTMVSQAMNEYTMEDDPV